jgi:hypothetical protein
MIKTNLNGWLKLVLILSGLAGTLISVGIIYASLNNGVNANCKEITILKPEVGKNTEHRLKDEVDTTYIKQSIQNIEQTQQEQARLMQEIYREVKK